MSRITMVGVTAAAAMLVFLGTAAFAAGGGRGGSGGGMSGSGGRGPSGGSSGGSAVRGSTGQSSSAPQAVHPPTTTTVPGNAGRQFTPNTAAPSTTIVPNQNLRRDGVTSPFVSNRNWEHRDGWNNNWSRTWTGDRGRFGDHNRDFWWFYRPYWYWTWYGYNDGDYYYDYPMDYTMAFPADNYAESVAVAPETTVSVNPTAGGERMYNDARTAFRSGNYRESLRLAQHAAVESPKSEKVHELLSLSLFALGDFRGAAVEAHAAASLGPVADWPALRDYYDAVATYKPQLDALKAAAQKDKASADTHFLLGYHFMMQGYNNRAKEEFGLVVKQAPRDEIAKHLLDELDKRGAGLID